MNLSDFKLLYTRSEDRLLLMVDTRGRGKLRCWLTRHFTRQWLADLQLYQHQAYLEQLTSSGTPAQSTRQTGSQRSWPGPTTSRHIRQGG